MPIPPDVVFETYPYRSSTTETSRALRTPLERINDDIDIREFGSFTTPSITRTTMQAAFDSGLNIRFSQGNYDIDGPINIPNDNHRRVIRGTGPDDAFGTAIRGNFRNFLWKTDLVYGGTLAISSISGISFQNHFVAPTIDPVTQVEPAGIGPFSGNGCGCLYLQLSWLRVTNCAFHATSGVGLFFPGINNYCSSFLGNGGFDGDIADTFSAGIWGSSCTITSGKPQGYRYGIVTMQGPTFLSEMDIEKCYTGIITTNPIAMWDRNSNEVVAARSQGGGKISMHALNFETMGSDFEGGTCMDLSGQVDISNVAISNAGQIRIHDPDAHIILSGAGGHFRNISGGGPVRVAGIWTRTGAQDYGSIWEAIGPLLVQTGKPVWKLLPQDPDDGAFGQRINSIGRNGHHFPGSAMSGAILWRQLPLSNPLVFNDQIISDCTLPEMDYSTTPPTNNHGKTVLNTGFGIAQGGGTNLTRVVHRPVVRLAALSSWTTASSTLSVTANPSNGAGGNIVQQGMAVWNDVDEVVGGIIQARGVYIGIVNSFISNVLTLATNQNTGSGTTAAAGGSAGDNLIFSCWTIA